MDCRTWLWRLPRQLMRLSEDIIVTSPSGGHHKKQQQQPNKKSGSWRLRGAAAANGDHLHPKI